MTPFSVQLKKSEEDKSSWEVRESALEQKIEDNSDKILKLENYWLEAQAVCKSVNEQLSETQSQYEALDKRYNKAKKLIKDYQQKWVCFRLQKVNCFRGWLCLSHWIVFIRMMCRLCE